MPTTTNQKKSAVKKTASTKKKKEVSPAKKPAEHKTKASSKYYAVGRRKSSVARVYYHISPQQEVIVNNKPTSEYFAHAMLQQIVFSPFEVTGFKKGKWMITVIGGGLRGQAESVRLGISRLLVLLDEKQKPILKKQKFLTRDPRVKERKKYGLKRARRAPQWQKR